MNTPTPTPAVHSRERARLAALEDYHIWRTPAEDDFDDLALLARHTCEMAHSYVVFVGEESLWVKAGAPDGKALELPSAGSLAAYAVDHPEQLHVVLGDRLETQFGEDELLRLHPNTRVAAALALCTPQGVPIGALVVGGDETCTLRAERHSLIASVGRQVMHLLELRRSIEDLQEERQTLASMNEELERFASVAAHDLRSPLRAMTSFAGLLRRRMADRTTASEVEMFDHVIGGAARLSAMVEGILSVAKAHHQDYGEASVLDLPTLVGEIADLVDPEQHHDIAFDGASKRIRASHTAVRQVLMNLMSNAVKYSDKPRGRIVVSCRQTEHENCLQVSDDGPGIDPQDQERIFEAFETGAAAPRVPSTGLGLALVRRVVDRLNGRIELQSVRGEGSQFTVWLPQPVA